KQWIQTINTNLNSAGLLCKLAISHFLETGGGRIINIVSRAAFRGDTGDYLAYAASKGGLVSLTKTIARSFGKNNIIAFSIAPGFVRTQMAKEFIEKNGEQQILNEISLPELTEAEDVAPTAVFLASGMMDHATGSTIDINAGSYMR
ncbi:MAG: SDR family NAD(P)-dependent oxidoreductase, partial [Bacteroidales bacterium]|nr:SDR family NAD(P)-dependent oxidoreductase [Bacteroidales bacterium]